jgi:hypothetical protein
MKIVVLLLGVLALASSCRHGRALDESRGERPRAALDDSCSAAPNQFVLVNERVNWKSMVEVSRRGPLELKSPIDYTKGRVYLRLDVREKPTSFPLGVQICMWGENGRETCSNYRELTIREKGVYYVDAGMPDGWWIKDGGIDWSGRWQHLRVMLRCSKEASETGCIFAQGSNPIFYKGADFESHVPIVFNANAIVVAPGKRLKPPAGWDCPADWGCLR